MFLDPLAVASASPAAPRTPTPARDPEPQADAAISEDARRLISEDARRTDWGLLEPFVVVDDDADDGVGLDAIAGEDADENALVPGFGSEAGVALASALLDAAASAPRGTHRWERWFEDASPASGRFGAALVALADRRRGRLVADADAKTKSKSGIRSSETSDDARGVRSPDDEPGDSDPRLPAPGPSRVPVDGVPRLPATGSESGSGDGVPRLPATGSEPNPNRAGTRITRAERGRRRARVSFRGHDRGGSSRRVRGRERRRGRARRRRRRVGTVGGVRANGRD